MSNCYSNDIEDQGSRKVQSVQTIFEDNPDSRRQFVAEERKNLQ